MIFYIETTICQAERLSYICIWKTEPTRKASVGPPLGKDFSVNGMMRGLDKNKKICKNACKNGKGVL